MEKLSDQANGTSRWRRTGNETTFVTLCLDRDVRSFAPQIVIIIIIIIIAIIKKILLLLLLSLLLLLINVVLLLGLSNQS